MEELGRGPGLKGEERIWMNESRQGHAIAIANCEVEKASERSAPFPVEPIGYRRKWRADRESELGTAGRR
jgi:hypothetical protein